MKPYCYFTIIVCMICLFGCKQNSNQVQIQEKAESTAIAQTKPDDKWHAIVNSIKLKDFDIIQNKLVFNNILVTTFIEETDEDTLASIIESLKNEEQMRKAILFSISIMHIKNDPDLNNLLLYMLYDGKLYRIINDKYLENELKKDFNAEDSDWEKYKLIMLAGRRNIKSVIPEMLVQCNINYEPYNNDFGA